MLQWSAEGHEKVEGFFSFRPTVQEHAREANWNRELEKLSLSANGSEFVCLFFLLWPCDNLVLVQTAINWIWIKLRLTGSGSNCNEVDLDKTVINCQLVQGAPPPAPPLPNDPECRRK